MDAHKNFAYSTVATAPSPATSGTSLVVASGQGALFPAVPFNATVWTAGAIPLSSNAEIVRVTAISTDTLTITRAQESTTARSIVVGDQIAATITVKTLTDAEVFTKNGTTLYPTASADFIGLGTATTAATPIHYISTADTNNFITLQTANYGTTYSPGGYTSTTVGRFTIGDTAIFTGVNADGRPNIIIQLLAYNATPLSARINTNESSFDISLETHWIAGLIYPLMELHHRMRDLSGVERRAYSMYGHKIGGYFDHQYEGEKLSITSIKTSSPGVISLIRSQKTGGAGGTLDTGTNGVWGEHLLYGHSSADYGGQIIFNHGATNIASIRNVGTAISLYNASTLALTVDGTLVGSGTRIVTVTAAGLLGTGGGSMLLAENTSIGLDPAGSADGKYSGITITAIAGYTQSFGDLVYLDPTDSRWELVDANSAAGADGDARGLLGMVVIAGTDGSACTILLQGNIRADAKFPTFTINNPIYISETAGSVTQTQPTTTDAVIRIIGAALTADELYFNPDWVWTTHT